MAPYSIDLRERVIRAWKTGKYTWDELASLFSIGVASVDRWVRAYRRTGRVEPARHGGGNPARVPADKQPILARLLDERPDLTLMELAMWYTAVTRVPASHSAVSRALKKMGVTRKKKRS